MPGKAELDESLDVFLDTDGYVRNGCAVNLAQGGGGLSE
jgi:hypothetical protein